MFSAHKFTDSFIARALTVLRCVHEHMEKIRLMVVFVASFMKHRMYLTKRHETINYMYYVFMKL